MSYKLVNLKNKKDEEFIQAFAGIPHEFDLIDLRNNDLGHKTSAELVQAFAAIPSGVTSLDLRQTGLEHKPGDEMAAICRAMPAHITNVHLYDEHNALDDLRLISSLKAIIDSEIARFSSFRNNFLVAIHVMEVSEAKIRAFEQLGEIIQNGFGKSRQTFHNELRLWKKNNWECIAKQRNFIHSFFSPGHKPASAIAIDDIFRQLAVSDKPETDIPPPDEPKPDSPKPDVPKLDVPKPDFPSPKGFEAPYVDPFKADKPAHVPGIEKFEKLLKEINGLVLEEKEKMKNRPEKGEGLSHVSEDYIKRLIDNMQDVTFSKNDFWNMIGQMGNKDIRIFVSKLNFAKNGAHASSEFDYLWRQFQGTEFQPKEMERRKNKFLAILENLSKEQLQATFESTDFLNILNQDIYADVLANALTCDQMALFAADVKRHEILDKMIIKLKPAPDLFSKLVAILPLLSFRMRTSIHNQLNHLPHRVPLKLGLVQLADFYIANNALAEKAAAELAAEKAGPKKEVPPPSKWAKIKIDNSPRYNTMPVDTKEWTEQAFEKFLQDLNALSYVTIKDNLIEALNSMPEDRIRMIVERAALPPFQTLLQHFWAVDASVTNHHSYTQARENRLKIVLQTMSEAQLSDAITDNKFWEIFGNTQQPFCNMAAEVLTAAQFANIALNADLDRHTDFARIINLVKKDTPQGKQRLTDIIEAILPHTTPWLVLTLQVKIRELLVKEQTTRLNTELNRHLNESMTRDDVMSKYDHDNSLNKNAVSLLFTVDTREKIEGYYGKKGAGL